jgi:hypothetical protein
MFKSYVIEVGDDQAGVIIREEGEIEYRFHAVLEAYSALDGRHFANALLAERAAIAHALSRRRRRQALSCTREGGEMSNISCSLTLSPRLLDRT